MPDGLKSGIESLSGVALDDVRVRYNSPEPARYRALAYTRASEIHVAPGEERHLPHEAWHVVQQKQGRVRPTGQIADAPINDDRALETEADMMGACAASAPGPALGERGPGRVGPGASGHAGVREASHAMQCRGVIQRFVETTSGGNKWRIADDFTMAVRQDSSVYGGRYFYADSGLVSSSNSKLKAQKSALSLTGGGGPIRVKSASKGIDNSLERVVPTNLSDASTGNDRASGMKWAEDCGVAANTVMHGSQFDTKGVFEGPSSVMKSSFMAKLAAHVQRMTARQRTTATVTYGTVYEVYRGRNFFSPHKMLDDIMAAAAEKRADLAWTSYQALSSADKDLFDQEVGLNKYATPDVGEAYSIVANKDENIDMGTWNFHWGGVVMKSGGDTVTMENFAGSGTDAWDFQMYGPASKAGQTFHEQQKSRTKADGVTPEYGDNPTTIRVRPV